MAPTRNGSSTAPQFVGVVGVAFLLILALFAGTFGIRRCLPRRFRRYSQDRERGLPVAGEISPLLPAPIAVPSPPEDYQQAADYGATALSPSPADKRENFHKHETEERDTLGTNAEKPRAGDEETVQETVTRPSGSAHAQSESAANNTKDSKKDSKKTSRRHSVGGASTHSDISASERLFGAPTSFAHSRSPHGGWHWGDGGDGEEGTSSANPDNS